MNDLLQPARHLTNEQCDNLLLSPDTDHPHLQSCALCSSQLTALRSSIGDLRTTSIAAADRHYRAALFSKALQQRQPKKSLGPRLAWAATAFAGLLFISLPFVSRFQGLRTTPAIAAPVTVPATVASNLSDEQLLSNIQSDLSASVPSPLLPLDSTSTTTTSSR
jgi:hypothetical protein